jgi:hypothetical protein
MLIRNDDTSSLAPVRYALNQRSRRALHRKRFYRGHQALLYRSNGRF